MELDRLIPSGTVIQGYHLCVSAALALDEGRLELGRTLYTQARAIAEASDEPWLNLNVRLGMGRYHRLAGNGAAARSWADDALVFAVRVGYRHEQGKAMTERWHAAWMCGDRTSAARDLRAAAEVFQELGTAFDLARAHLLLAALLHEQDRPEAASAWLEAGRSILAGGYAFLLDQEHPLAYPLIAKYLGHSDLSLAAIGQQLADHLRRVPAPPLRILTLGRFEVWQGHRHIEKRALHTRQGEELLVLLLFAPGHSLFFDQVAEALWREKGARAARAAFHHATSALRLVLEPDLPEKFPSRYLDVEEGRVTLRLPAGSEVDAVELERQCHRDEWEAALATYAGEFMPDFLYADWTFETRKRLSLLYQRAFAGCGRRAPGSGPLRGSSRPAGTSSPWSLGTRKRCC
ncbi:MAG: AfsR/SARP family transcriptional regulator [Chloroflexia bacterium]